MQKLACVFSFKESSWVSCQKIVFNLHKSYELVPRTKLINFNYSEDQDGGEIYETAQKIFQEQPDVIVILDHKPHPLHLLELLLPMYGKNTPRIIFHIFGDFTLYYSDWKKLGVLIKGLQTNFLVASERQKNLIDKFLPDKSASRVCPFPIEENEFRFDPFLRTQQRKDWNVKDDEIVYIFTGRISFQKKIHTILKSFSEFISSSDKSNFRLFIYGTPDHIGDRFLGRWEAEGEYFRKVHRLYQRLPISVQNKIHFMGGVPNKELIKAYQGADFLINLSIHNDEDFGMSVAEAQASGLPAILTDWGGLAGFKSNDYPEMTSFVPVRIGKESKLVHFPSIIDCLCASVLNFKNLDRKKISNIAHKRFGLKAVSLILNDVLSNKATNFSEFTEFFQTVNRLHQNNQFPYLTPRKTINTLYRRLYSSYVRNP